mmetsp:Transcript_26940/g.75744  ORF Transcript_26940/g.75744 Transcript_26940/m.75744 type:complete len:220 (-) Transcript_26940:1168-1827(-)
MSGGVDDALRRGLLVMHLRLGSSAAAWLHQHAGCFRCQMDLVGGRGPASGRRGRRLRLRWVEAAVIAALPRRGRITIGSVVRSTRGCPSRTASGSSGRKCGRSGAGRFPNGAGDLHLAESGVLVIEDEFVRAPQIPHELRRSGIPAVLQHGGLVNQLAADEARRELSVMGRMGAAVRHGADFAVDGAPERLVERQLQHLIDDFGIHHALLLLHEFRRMP